MDLVSLMTLAPSLLVAAAVLIYARNRQARERAGLTPGVEVTVRVPLSLYRAAQKPLVRLVVSALTGVSVTFSPLALFLLGGGSLDDQWDWRVIACFLVTYLVPMFYMRAAAPVLQHLWDNRRPDSPNAP